MADEEKAVESAGELERLFTDALKAEEVEDEVVEEPVAEEPAVEEEPVVEEEAPLDPILEAAKAAGLEGYEDKDKIFQDLVEYKKQLEESRPYVDYAKQLLPHQEKIQKALAVQEQPEQYDQNTHFDQKWQSKQLKSAWEPYLRQGAISLDDNGKYVAAEGMANQVPVEVIQGLNEYREWQRDALEQILENPYKRTWEAIQEPLERFVSQQLEQRLSSVQKVSEVDQWEQEHSSDLYQLDQSGKMAMDSYGNPRLTEYGESFTQAVREVKATVGDNVDDIALLRLAERMVQKPSQKEPEPEKTVPEPSIDEVAEKKKKSFLDEALEKAGHSPNSGGYAESTDTEPVVMSQRELDNLFIAELRKQKVT